MRSERQALVIGCGVSGLSTAIRMQEAGWQVVVQTAEPPLNTTSNVAAAIWYPYRAYPQERVLAWGMHAYQVFVELAGDPKTGVYLRRGLELSREPLGDPWWAEAVPGLRRCRTDELRPGYRDGYVFTVPVIEMPVYLRYLVERFQDAGGRIEHRTVRSLAEAAHSYPIVANCTGIGARVLAGDPDVRPIRGQVVRVRNPGLDDFILDEDHPEGVTYIVPRTEDCILGGTAEEGSWETTPDSTTAESILRRCIAIEPRLEGAVVLEHKVGLRPGRPAIRLERDDAIRDGCCIHNYGHGGAGVTLSWGCAEEVVAIANTYIAT